MTDEQQATVEHTIRICARPETVWAYWTDPERIRDWWASDAELDPRPGGICRVVLGGGGVMRGEFVELVPYKRIVFTFGWESSPGAPPVAPGSTTVEITLTEDGGDTIMSLRHTSIPAAVRDLHQSGWAYFLTRLAAGASHRNPSESHPPVAAPRSADSGPVLPAG